MNNCLIIGCSSDHPNRIEDGCRRILGRISLTIISHVSSIGFILSLIRLGVSMPLSNQDAQYLLLRARLQILVQALLLRI